MHSAFFYPRRPIFFIFDGHNLTASISASLSLKDTAISTCHICLAGIITLSETTRSGGDDPSCTKTTQLSHTGVRW